MWYFDMGVMGILLAIDEHIQVKLNTKHTRISKRGERFNKSKKKKNLGKLSKEECE